MTLWWRLRRHPPAAAPPPVHPHGLPWPTLSKPRWRTAAYLSMLAGLTVNAASAAAYALTGEDWPRMVGNALVWLLLFSMIICMGEAMVRISPRRGVVTYRDGRRVRVRFTPDPDRPPGTYVAKTRGGRPVSPDDAIGVTVNAAQIHQVLRIGDLLVPVSLLIQQGQRFTRPAPPS